MTITKMEHMINPEVLASMVDGELEFALKFTNLATVDHTLVGRAGNTVSLPAYKMIGEAEDVAEGEAIPVEFADFLISDSDEATTQRVDLFKNAFNEAVEKLVNERLKGNTPKSSASTTNTMTKEKFRSMSYKEKMDLYNNNKDLFEKLSK